MNEVEYTMISASIPLMDVDELEALRSAMAKQHDETKEEEFARLHDEVNYCLDWIETLQNYGMTEDEYKRYWSDIALCADPEWHRKYWFYGQNGRFYCEICLKLAYIA